MAFAELVQKVQDFTFQRLEYYFDKRSKPPVARNFQLEEKSILSLSPLIQEDELSNEETLILALVLVPHLQPELYSNLIQYFLPQGGDLPIFGGVKGKNHRGVLPTGETLQFLIAGQDVAKRIQVMEQMKKSVLLKYEILNLEPVAAGEPEMSGRLSVSDEWVEKILTGKSSLPAFGPDFPAQKIETERSWDSLVMAEEVLEQIKELQTWIHYNQKLMDDWQMRKKLKPGYRVMFYGPPGTGKTLTATLLGKYTGRPVFQVDLSTIVSKYIGETEKNLEKLFSKAQNRDWILFFDEADALFGKRTDVGDAHDRFANQEVSYLLQRVENFKGMVILSTNFKSNIDDAFLRRFNAIIKFPFPDACQRKTIWEKSLPERIALEDNVDLSKIASTYKLTGGNIINAVQYASLKTIGDQKESISLDSILKGIKREVEKEGKIFNKLPDHKIYTNGLN